MAINKKLIKYATKARFTADLGNSLIPNTSIVFIQDTGELWTHGTFFGGKFSSVNSNYGTLTLDGSSVNLSLYGHKHSYTDLLGSTTTANQVIVSNGTANGWTLKTLGSGAFDSTSYLPLSGGTLTGVLQLSNSGLKFADNAFGGGNDIAKMYLTTKGGEATTMTFEVGNDSDDTINFITPSSTGLTHNGNTIWHAGNDGSGSGLDADMLDGYHKSDLTAYTTTRNFINGTTITTSIDYSNTSGDPFYIEIKGNSYFRNNSVYTQIQGYIYDNTIISYGVTHLGYHPISGLVALNVNGKLTIWFPRQDYWEGYSIVANSGYNYSINLVESVTDTTKPSGTKEVNLESNTKTSAFTDSNVASATRLETSRSLTIGSTAKSFDGTANVSWSLSEIGAAAAIHSHTISQITDIGNASVNYATTAGSVSNADTVDGLHASSFVKFLLNPIDSGSTATSAQSYWTNSITSGSITTAYNVPGAEYSLIFSKSTGDCGSIIKWGYADTYLYIIRRDNSWKDTNWQKISAGYADTAGSAPASDVYAWAKSAIKPSYDTSEVAENGNLYLTNQRVIDALPINTILKNLSDDNPFGSKWLKCDGSLVSKTDYPKVKLKTSSLNSGISVTGINYSYFNSSSASYKRCVIYKFNKYYHYDSNGVFVSNDSLSWTKIISTPIRGGGFYGDKFIYIGTNIGYYSTDGISFSTFSLSPIVSIDNSNYDCCIEYGNNRYVILIRYYNTYIYSLYSTDGITWTSGWTSGNGIYQINDFAFGNGYFVASLNSYIYYSTDGITWTKTTTQCYYNGLFFNGNKFIASSNSSSKYTSTNGVTWTSYTSDTYPNAYQNNLFIYAANKNIKYSSDAITWTTSLTLTGSYDYVPQVPIIYSGGVYKWFGLENMYNSMQSTDLTSLSNRYNLGLISLTNGKIIYYNKKYFIYIYNYNFTPHGHSYTSSDLINFSEVTSVSYGDVIKYKNKLFIFNYSNLQYSTDGINWITTNYLDSSGGTITSHGTSSFTTKYIIEVNNVLFDINYKYYSYDGITWYSLSLFGNYSDHIYGITYISDRYYGILYNNSSSSILPCTSVDLKSWVTLSTTSLSSYYTNLIYYNKYIIGVSTSDNYLYYSNDGITWTITSGTNSRSFSDCTFKIISDILIICNSEYCYYSTDGVNYTNLSIDGYSYSITENTDSGDIIVSSSYGFQILGQSALKALPSIEDSYIKVLD